MLFFWLLSLLAISLTIEIETIKQVVNIVQGESVKVFVEEEA